MIVPASRKSAHRPRDARCSAPLPRAQGAQTPSHPRRTLRPHSPTPCRASPDCDRPQSRCPASARGSIVPPDDPPRPCATRKRCGLLADVRQARRRASPHERVGSFRQSGIAGDDAGEDGSGVESGREAQPRFSVVAFLGTPLERSARGIVPRELGRCEAGWLAFGAKNPSIAVTGFAWSNFACALGGQLSTGGRVSSVWRPFVHDVTSCG
jgi:hypothetical protein